MRQIFELALNNNRTILLTSHSIEECEYLSRRIGIMSNGSFIYIGFIENLKRKNSYSYKIHIKIKSNHNLNLLLNYLKSKFNIINYSINDLIIILQINHSSLKYLFSLIEFLKEKFFIETFFLQEITLEDCLFNNTHENMNHFH